MEYIHVIWKILRPKGFIFTRYPGGTTPGSLVRELAAVDAVTACSA